MRKGQWSIVQQEDLTTKREWTDEDDDNDHYEVDEADDEEEEDCDGGDGNVEEYDDGHDQSEDLGRVEANSSRPPEPKVIKKTYMQMYQRRGVWSTLKQRFFLDSALNGYGGRRLLLSLPIILSH